MWSRGKQLLNMAADEWHEGFVNGDVKFTIGFEEKVLADGWTKEVMEEQVWLFLKLHASQILTAVSIEDAKYVC